MLSSLNKTLVLTTGAKFLAGMRSAPTFLGVGFFEPAMIWALAGATAPNATPAAPARADGARTQHGGAPPQKSPMRLPPQPCLVACLLLLLPALHGALSNARAHAQRLPARDTSRRDTSADMRRAICSTPPIKIQSVSVRSSSARSHSCTTG